jgi:A/G-specific adenine glycosylase
MALKSIPRTREPKSAQRFTRALLAWFERAGRDLPWRRTRDPYRIVVSEFMLQQTQVSRVLEYYPRFLKRFPTVGKLAAAKPKAVREEWEGLGYYARARNLHRTAKQVTLDGGQWPETPEELIKLPGIGRYTAGAVATFAYEKPVPAVDTNVGRVIRRAFVGDSGFGIGDGEKRKREKRIWEVATTLVPKDGKRAWRFNQAIMELGAVICTARKPKCPECPVRKNCKTGRRLVRRQTPRRTDA